MRELVITAKCQFDSDAKAFDGHNGDRADERAYGDIHNGICPSIFGDDRVDHKKRENNNTEAI